jgi:hypothetical protein
MIQFAVDLQMKMNHEDDDDNFFVFLLPFVVLKEEQ